MTNGEMIVEAPRTLRDALLQVREYHLSVANDGLLDADELQDYTRRLVAAVEDALRGGSRT